MAKSGGIRAGKAYVEVGTDNTKLERGLRAAQRQLRAFGSSVRALGMRMVRFSAAALLPFAALTVVFARFEQRMARVKALTGAVGADFEKLNVEAKRLGKTTVFSATQAAEAMGVFAQAGLDVNQILAVLAPTLRLAAAGQLEMAMAADMAVKIL
ncbi:unnamed protein product, partial [marine sediment metagenome]